jgi:hypothetical protein
MKKFFLIIEDDFELMGNGLGNVASHQYLPTLFLIKVANNLGLKLTFMVDVAQQLVFDEYQHLDANLKTQKDLWDETVRQIKLNGHDVQLHLHAQWLNCEYKNGYFFLDKNWSIARVEQQTRKILIKDSIDYLTNLLKPIDPDYKVNSFKAGSWALQPSEELFADFSEAGIKVVMGVRKDMNVSGLGVNYENLDEDTLPYFPDHSDIRKIGKKGDLMILPLSYVYPGWKDMFDLGRTLYNDKKVNKRMLSPLLENSVPKDIRKNSPTGEKVRFRIKRNPYLTHLKIGGARSTSYYKNTFDKTINRLRKKEGNGIPVVIESHTKNFLNNYKDIDQFLDYMVKKYSHEIEFVTMSEYIKKVSELNLPVKEL